MQSEYKNVNTNKLHNELIASGIVPLLVESLDDTTWITFADGTDLTLVQAIIDVHDMTPPPMPKSENQLFREQNTDLNLQIIDIYEILLTGGII